jgi:hypothetical protein
MWALREGRIVRSALQPQDAFQATPQSRQHPRLEPPATDPYACDPFPILQVTTRSPATWSIAKSSSSLLADFSAQLVLSIVVALQTRTWLALDRPLLGFRIDSLDHRPLSFDI